MFNRGFPRQIWQIITGGVSGEAAPATISVSITATVLSASATIEDTSNLTILAGSGTAVTATALSATATIEDTSNLTITAGGIATPSAISATATISAPTILAGVGVTITATVLATTAHIPSVTPHGQLPPTIDARQLACSVVNSYAFTSEVTDEYDFACSVS